LPLNHYYFIRFVENAVLKILPMQLNVEIAVQKIYAGKKERLQNKNDFIEGHFLFFLKSL